MDVRNIVSTWKKIDIIKSFNIKIPPQNLINFSFKNTKFSSEILNFRDFDCIIWCWVNISREIKGIFNRRIFKTDHFSNNVIINVPWPLSTIRFWAIIVHRIVKKLINSLERLKWWWVRSLCLLQKYILKNRSLFYEYINVACY